MARVFASGEAWGVGGARGKGRILLNGGRESSVFTTGLSLELRGSCVVSTAATARIPSFVGPMVSLMVRTSCDERGWSRQEGVGVGSGYDGPDVEAGGPCGSPEPLVAVVVETSSRSAMSVGALAMAGKQRCVSDEDVKESITGGLGVLVSSRLYLMATTWAR